MLATLKEKVQILVSLVHELKEKNCKLQEQKDALQKTYDQLVESNASLVHENEELKIDFALLQESVSKENSQIKELTKERSEAKDVVSDLIESIDKLVEHEVQ